MIQSVEKAMRILNFVADSRRQPVKLGDIARGLNLDSATCAHITDTMCRLKYLERVSRAEGYVIGPQLYHVANTRMYKEDLIRVASPFMMRLCHDLRENVSMSTYLQNVLYVVYTISFHEVNVRRRWLSRGKLYQSASGRVILAYMDSRELEEVLSVLGYPPEEDWPGVSDRDALMFELNNIRLSGTCIAPNLFNGNSAVACPLFINGKVQAAMGAYMEPHKFMGEHLERAIALTQQAAGAINKRIETLSAARESFK